MLRFILGLLAFFTAITAQAQVSRFNDEVLRDKLIRFKDNPPETELRIEGQSDSEAKQRFLDFYRESVFPGLVAYKKMELRYRGLHILVDAYLHRSEAEREAWAGAGGEFEKIMAEETRWSTDPKWTTTLKKWASLAEGLPGDLPDLARRMATERELEVFDESLVPLLDEAARLEKDYMIAINETAAGRKIGQYRSLMSEISRKFKGGEISFPDAQQEIRAAMQTMGPHFVGYEAVQRAGENLNKMAVIRARLAKAKGLTTWAEYALERSGQGYSPDYRGPANQRAFLESYIRALKPLRDHLIEKRIQELNLDRRSVRQQNIGLLTPPGFEQLTPYFPREALVDMWEETLLESGFSPETLKNLHIDILPRDGKNPTAAYMSGFLGQTLATEVIDAETLSRKLPPFGSNEYRPGFVYILQNFGASGGLRDLEVLFHEGGHGLERLLNYKMDLTDEAYGYVEVPSMTSERYARDPILLWRKARPVDGMVPSLAEIRKLALNEEQSGVLDLLAMAKTALYDLNLWDYDYSAPEAMTYLQRAEMLTKELDQLTGGFPQEETPVPLFYWAVTTSHFISGSVRNIGYTYAEIASRMMSRYFTNVLEDSTGRPTWFRQPELANLFAKHFFAEGWKTTFPENIEAITGQKFCAEAVVKEMAAQLEQADCESKLL